MMMISCPSNVFTLFFTECLCIVSLTGSLMSLTFATLPMVFRLVNSFPLSTSQSLSPSPSPTCLQFLCLYICMAILKVDNSSSMFSHSRLVHCPGLYCCGEIALCFMTSTNSRQWPYIIYPSSLYEAIFTIICDVTIPHCNYLFFTIITSVSITIATSNRLISMSVLGVSTAMV